MTIANRKQISSGFEGFDRILGGLFVGDNVVFYDESGSLARTFWHRFVKTSLDAKTPVIFASFDRSPKNLFERLGTMGKNPLLTVLDCFTYGKGKGADAFLKFLENAPASVKKRVVSVDNPWDVKEFSDTLYEVHGKLEGDVHLVFESLTGMQEVWGGEEHVGAFYTHSCPRLYDLSTVAYWVMEKQAHSDRLRAQINQVAQVAVDLSIKRGTSSASVIKAEGRESQNIQQPNKYHLKGAEVVFEGDQGAGGFQAIGTRIKQLRIRKGLSQVQLAKLVGVTASTISQVENNAIYPSIPGLLKMAEILSVAPGYLFSSESERKAQTVFPSSQASHVNIANIGENSGSVRMLTPLDFSGSVEPFLIEIEPGQTVSGHFFTHRGDEMGYVLEGSVEMWFGDDLNDAVAGDMIYLHDQTPTRWINSGTHSTKLLWMKIK